MCLNVDKLHFQDISDALISMIRKVLTHYTER